MNEISEPDEDSSSRIGTTMNLDLSDPPLVLSQTIYKEELQKWVQKSIAYTFFFVFLQLWKSLSLPFFLSFIPLLWLDCQIFVNAYLFNRTALWRIFLTKQVIHQVCSITFKILLVIYYYFKPFKALIIVIPIIITSLYDLFISSPKLYQCKYMTWTVLFI